MQQQSTNPLAHPKRLDIFLHGIKTFRLLGSLLIDSRIHIIRKLLFIGSIGALLILLFFPDLLSEAFLSIVLPIVGTVLGVPLDAGMDWIAFALLLVNLLRYFPTWIVEEHYGRIFG